MLNKTDRFKAGSGWLPSGPGKDRYALVLDVLIFVPGLALAGLVLAAQYFSVQRRNPLFDGRLLILLTVPSLAGLISAVCRWKVTPLIAFVSVASYWGLFGLLGGLGLQGFALFLGILPPLLLLFAIAVYTAVFMGVRTGPIWPVLAVMVGIICGASMFSVKMNRWERERHPMLALDPLPLGPDMVTINKCTHLFRLLNPEAGYPESLQQMGPQGSGCLPPTLVESKQKGFLLTYRPGEHDTKGRVASYTVRAEQASPHGPDFSVMWSDESGLILMSFQGPHGKGGLYAYRSPAYSFEYLVGCLRRSMVEHKLSAEEADQDVRRCWGQSGMGEGYIMGRGHLKSACLEITYTFEISDSTMMDSFIAMARPVTYGDCGTRSYLIEAKGNTLRMYATGKNRPAARSDPLAKMCELRENGHCASPAEIN